MSWGGAVESCGEQLTLGILESVLQRVANERVGGMFSDLRFRPVCWLGIWKGGLSEPLWAAAASAATSPVVPTSTTSITASSCASAVSNSIPTVGT